MTRRSSQKRLTIESFVRNTLGCNCPDEVFSHIRIEPPTDALSDLGLTRIIKIGGRLMVAVCVPSGNTEALDLLKQIFKVGKTVRDQLGFNRFRAVVVSDDPPKVAPALADRFSALADLDDRLHLHVISPSELPVYLN